MNGIRADWAEFSVDRLARLYHLRRYCDGYADAATKLALQHAIFSIYLDCQKAGITPRALEVLRGQATETAGVSDPAGACAP